MARARAAGRGRGARHVALVLGQRGVGPVSGALGALGRPGGVAHHHRAARVRGRHRRRLGAEPGGCPSLPVVLRRLGAARRPGEPRPGRRVELWGGTRVPVPDRALSRGSVPARNEDGGQLVPH